MLEFHTRPAFEARAECTRALGGCLPVALGIRFTAPFPRQFASSFRLVGPDGSHQPATIKADDLGPQIRSVHFPGQLIEDAVYRIELTGSVRDIDGRPLANVDDFPMPVRTRRLPPGATFFGDLTVIEVGAKPTIPLLLRRPTELADCLPCRVNGRVVGADGDADVLDLLRRVAATTVQTVHYDPAGKPYRTYDRPWNWPSSPVPVLPDDVGTPWHAVVDTSIPYQLLALPAARGYRALEIALPRSPPIGGFDHVAAGALVTDMAVHLIRGRESSVVWVTRLADAGVVAGARVRVADTCTGEALWSGETDDQGLARIQSALPQTGDCHPFYGDYLVSARTDDDFSFVITGWERDRWAMRDRRIELTTPNTLLHVVFDRSLYMPGQRVAMKLVLRTPVSDGLAIPAKLPATGELVLEHDGSRQSFSMPVGVDARGNALAHFDLPPTAQLGWYDARLRLHGTDWRGGAFRVEEFRVGAMRGEITVPGRTMVDPDVVPLGLSVSYLGGGGAARAAVTVRTLFQPDSTVLGTRRPDVETEAELTLDADGRATHRVANLPDVGLGARLSVEMDYFDASGEKVTTEAWTVLLPAALHVSADNAGYSPSGQRRIRIEVLDLDEAPVAGREVDATLHAVPGRHFSTVARLAGGFRTSCYGASPPAEFVGDCSGVTDTDGHITCDLPGDSSAQSIIVSSRVADAEGRMGEFEHSVYPDRRASGQHLVLTDLNRRRKGSRTPYMPGEVARVEASTTFEDATALVTVEREGILDAFVTPVRGPASVISVPVHERYAPNIEVAVLAIRGRIAPAPVLADVDAATLVGADGRPIKPSDAAGPNSLRAKTWIRVDTAHHELNVAVRTDREVYRVRDAVEVGIEVTRPDGEPAGGGEVAIAVVDEALLERWPNASWRILERMMNWRRVDTESATGLRGLYRTIDYPPQPSDPRAGAVYEMVVTGSYGRRDNFEMPSPGDVIFDHTYQLGTASRPEEGPVARKDFDRLVLWQGRVLLDDHGKAEVAFPLNDLLTSFRIAAVAEAGTDLFGTGETSIRTTQDLIVHAGLPPTVREGDRFDAAFTVQNPTQRTQDVEVVPSLNGRPLDARHVTLTPGGSRELAWTVTVPNGVLEVSWQVDATADSATDRLQTTQQVLPLVPVEVQQATIRQLDESAELPVEKPAKALPGKGGVRVALMPTLGVGLDAVRDHMGRYPYTCIEQQVSAAVVLGASPERWATAMQTATAALDHWGLLRFFPREGLQGSTTLTAYVLTIADVAGRAIPDDLRQRMLTGLKERLPSLAQPRAPYERGSAWTKSLPILAALARYGELEPSMLPLHDQNLALAPSSALLDWIDTLTRLAPQHPELPVAKRLLYARLNLQGTTMALSTEARDHLWWQMVSTDANAARMLLLAFDEPGWDADLPQLMRGLFGRQQRGRWDTTVANAWGAVATERFRTSHEAEPVSGASAIRLGESDERVHWIGDQKPQPIVMPWSSAETLTLDHEGAGMPWSLVALEAAVPIERPVQRGYRIERTVTPIRREGRRWRRGDVAEVTIGVEADRDMTWVVVEDPIPAGATILGGGLGGDSAMLADDGLRSGHRWPAFVERTLTSYRAYYAYVPKGALTLRYRVRYNTAGRFNMPPTRVEAMYAPEMHAQRPVAALNIR
ncbi:MAG: MG2 domain-containing protein [Gammaproteobacteria bacterium]|nr:MG2 domain-containing protein [Gammaproteobacteria bacterium]